MTNSEYTNLASISRVIEGIYWAIDQNVDIINLSFGTTQNSEALYLAIKAAYPEVMAVGSVDSTGTISDFCSTGAIFSFCIKLLVYL